MNRVSVIRWYGILLLLVSSSGIAGNSPKSIVASRTEIRPTLDGALNEPEWQLSSPVLDFTQFDPFEGALPTEQTSVRILYDDHALYVGVICYDSHPDLMVHQLTRRDRSSEAERFTVQIDSYHDRQTAFVFSTNIAGVQTDGVLSQDGLVYDISWDAVWRVETRVYDDGWSAEFEIPFDALRFAPSADGEYVWGINFRRYISRKREIDEWVMIPRSEKLQVSRWGTVSGIRKIDPPLHLAILPYVSGASTFETPAHAGVTSPDNHGDAGVDIKYGLTRGLTLDAAFNPDFGQVEVDRAVLNLTVFETYYPEKRPFFSEGAQLFSFGTLTDNTAEVLFFSRRIGRRPLGSYGVIPPTGGTIVSNPLSTTILGAAKLSGRTHDGFSVGVATAVTDEELAVVRDSLGFESKIRTEPRGSYSVVRLKRDLPGYSWVGMIATLAARDGRLPAISGGLDWNFRFGEGNYTFDGFVAGTRSSVTNAERDGMSGKLLVGRIAGEHWSYFTAYDLFTRGYNPNALGFFAQPHDHGGYVQVQYRENFAAGALRRYTLTSYPSARWNWDGLLTTAAVQTTYGVEFKNFWSASLSHTFSPPAYDDEERGIIGTYRRPAGHAFTVQLKTDEHSALTGTFTAGFQMDALDTRGFNASLAATARPAPWVELVPAVGYVQVRGEETGVFSRGSIASVVVAGTNFSLFGKRDVDELDFSLRGIVTFSRNLSLQCYSQVLLARGTYDDFRRLVGGSDLRGDVTVTERYDFNQATVNANVLLRWEYLVGSTIYLVWTQGRYDDSRDYQTGFGRRFNEAFQLPHEDVLLLKINYLLPF